MKKVGLLMFLMFFGANLYAQKGKVSLEIINEDGTVKEVKFDWPFSGPPSIGASEELVEKVDSTLSQNKIDCPPKREKVSDNIWKCGNGKKIRAKDERLARVLSKAWDETE